MRERLRPLFAIAITALLLTGIVALLVDPFDPDVACCDHLLYRSMSYNLFTVTRPALNAPPDWSMFADPLHQRWAEYWKKYPLNRVPPYVYRVVTPLSARGVAYATGIDAAYYLISFLALAGAAVLIGLSILELSGSVIPALAGVVLFLINPWTAKFNLWDYMLTDPMAFFFTALAIWALVKRNRPLFFVACAIGVLNKESMVPMVVAYPLTEWWIDHRVRSSSVVAAVGIVVGYAAFRAAMPEAVSYSILGELKANVDHARAMTLAWIATFGVMLPAAFLRPWGSRLMIALVPFAATSVLEAAFVGDLERAMVQALPAVCVGIFWLWPVDLREQLLTLAVVPIFALSLLSYGFLIGIVHYIPLLGLLLIAALCELWLWRSSHPDHAVAVAVTSPR